jgi:hypothetical protein
MASAGCRDLSTRPWKPTSAERLYSAQAAFSRLDAGFRQCGRHLPDGRHAIATKRASHKAVLLDISEDRKLAVGKDLWVGLFPCNVAFSPDGRRALVNNIGNNGQSDGNAKTVRRLEIKLAVRRSRACIPLPRSCRSAGSSACPARDTQRVLRQVDRRRCRPS